jgi:hypothetical protein
VEEKKNLQSGHPLKIFQSEFAPNGRSYGKLAFKMANVVAADEKAPKVFGLIFFSRNIVKFLFVKIHILNYIHHLVLGLPP